MIDNEKQIVVKANMRCLSLGVRYTGLLSRLVTKTSDWTGDWTPRLVTGLVPRED